MNLRDLAFSDDLGDELEELPPEPPRRPVKATPAHRQIPKATEKVSGTSWWLGKSRDELSAAASERVPEMRNSKEALHVKGTTRES